jgi:hypothetical protein
MQSINFEIQVIWWPPQQEDNVMLDCSLFNDAFSVAQII